MKKTVSILVLILSVHLTGWSQTVPDEKSYLSLRFNPGTDISFGPNSQFIQLIGKASLSGRFNLPFFPFLYATAGLDYSYISMVSGDSRSLISGIVGAGVEIKWQPFGASVYAKTGLGYGFTNNVGNMNGSMNPLIQLGGEISFSITPEISLGVDVSYNNTIGMCESVGVTVGTAHHVPYIEPETPVGPQQQLKALDLVVSDVQFGEVFPVFFKYYDENPLGRTVIVNRERKPIDDVTVSFYVEEYMISPKQCATIPHIQPGEEVEVPLYALFTDKVLGIIEPTKVTSEIILEYTQGNREYRETNPQSLRIYDRNSITWEDDKRIAAFVTAKDPNVLEFAKHVTGVIRGQSPEAVDDNLVKAIGIFEALSVFGINYEYEPKASYKELRGKEVALDFIQFPGKH